VFGLRTTFWITGGINLLCVPLLLSGVSDRAIAEAEREGRAAKTVEPVPSQ